MASQADFRDRQFLAVIGDEVSILSQRLGMGSRLEAIPNAHSTC